MLTPATVPLRVSIPWTRQLLQNPITVFSHYRERYGDSFYLNFGGQRRPLFTTDPKVAQHVLQKNHRNYEKSEIQSDQLALYLGKGLLTNTGASWLRQRRLIQPGFHRERLAVLVDSMQQVIRKELDAVTLTIRQNPVIDIYPVMLQTTFRIIARALFSEDIDAKSLHYLSQKITQVQEFIIYPVRLPFLRPLMRWVGIQQYYQKQATDAFAVLQRLVHERRASGSKRDDLLQMLLDARYEDSGEPMDDQQLLEELVVLFVAGHETTANALSWTLYLLSQHPESAEEIRAEADRVLNGSSSPSLAQLRDAQYLTQVLEESMRLYPPAWITDRIALADDEIEGCPIPKDTVIVPFIYGIHHHPDLWDQPELFRPERFQAEARKHRPAYAYLPFGGGPRMCIGNNFALIEMQLVIAEWLRRFSFQLHPDPLVKPKVLVTLRPKHGIPLRMKERKAE